MFTGKACQFFKLTLFLFFCLAPLHAAGAQNTGNRLSEKIVLARGLVDDGLYSLAVRELETYIKEELRKDEFCPANLLIGKAYYYEKRYEEAIDRLPGIIDRPCSLREQEEAYYYLGMAYFESGKYGKAKKVMERLLYLYPESEFRSLAKDVMARSFYDESLHSFDSEDYKKALKGFNKVLTLDSKKVPEDLLQIKIGDSLFYLGEYEKAEAVYNKALSRFDLRDESRIRFQLANIKYNTDNFDDAIKLMKAFLKDFPSHSLSRSASNIILWSLYKKGEYEEAYNYFNGLKNTGGNINSNYKKIVDSARQFLKLGRTIDAKRYLEENLLNLGEDPLDGEMMLLLAKAYKGSGLEFLEAETYKEIINRYPLSDAAGRSRYLLGKINYENGNFREASTQFNLFLEANELGNLSDDAIYYRAESFLKMGEIEKARNGFRSIVESYKDSGFFYPALVKTADIDFMTGYYMRAAARYGDILSMKEGSLDKEEISWKKAESLRRGGEYEKAVKGYEEFIDSYPKSSRLPDALVKLGNLKYLLGNYKGGIKVFRRILSNEDQDKKHPESYLKLAWGYLNLKDIPDYLKVLKQVIEEYPESEEAAVAYYLKGMAADSAGKYELANENYFRILNKFPKTSLKEEVEWRVGINYFNLKRYDDAIKSFRSYSLSYPESSRDSEEWIMKSYAAFGDYKKAVETSSTFFQISPDSSIDLKKRYDEALALYEVAAYRDAIKLARSIIGGHPSHNLSPKLQHMIGEAYLKLNSKSKAVDYFNMSREALSPGPLKNLSFFRAGEMLFENNDFRGAILEFDKVDESVIQGADKSEITRYTDPEYLLARLHFLKGEAYLNLKLFDKAIANYQIFVEDYPGLSGLNDERRRAGMVFQKNNRYDLAIKAMKQILAHSNDSELKVEAQYWIGENYQYKGDMENAIIEYLKVTYLYPEEYMWGLTARYMAAQVYEETGHYEDAIKLYNIVAVKSNDKSKTEFARQRVKELERKMSGAEFTNKKSEVGSHKKKQ